MIFLYFYWYFLVWRHIKLTCPRPDLFVYTQKYFTNLEKTPVNMHN